MLGRASQCDCPTPHPRSHGHHPGWKPNKFIHARTQRYLHVKNYVKALKETNQSMKDLGKILPLSTLSRPHVYLDAVGAVQQ